MIIYYGILLLTFSSLSYSSDTCCYCVPYKLCGTDGVITEQGIRLIGDNFGRREKNVAQCRRKYQECCRHPDTDSTCFNSMRPDNSDKIMIDSQWIGVVVKATHQFQAVTPHQEEVAVASLIHPSMLITAAHLIIPYVNDELYVRFGEPTNDRRYDRFKAIRVKDINIHPGYREAGLINDIAVIILEEENRSRSVSRMPIARRLSKLDLNECIITSTDKKNVTTSHKAIYMDSLTCQTVLRRTRLPSNFDLADSTICASSNSKNVCELTAGGSLICKIRGRRKYRQIGVLSWDVGCNEMDVPSVFQDITSNFKWIKQQLKQLRKNRLKKEKRRNKKGSRKKLRGKKKKQNKKKKEKKVVFPSH